MRHGHGRAAVDSYVVVPQRHVVCTGCGSTYNGPKEQVECRGCGVMLATEDVRCSKKIPTGQWVIANQRSSKPQNGS